MTTNAMPQNRGPTLLAPDTAFAYEARRTGEYQLGEPAQAPQCIKWVRDYADAVTRHLEAGDPINFHGRWKTSTG
jgi:hypothetical protein